MIANVSKECRPTNTKSVEEESTLTENESSTDFGRQNVNGEGIPGLAGVESSKPAGAPSEHL